jgi:mono/diheme cytochrome c family protein
VRRGAFPAVLILFLVPFLVKAMPPSAARVVNGRRIFNQSCSACHDVFGPTAKTGPELKNYYRRQRPSDAAIRRLILEGKGKMPAFTVFNNPQVDDLIAYLKTL